jgi:nitronate monooxygenase
MAYPLPSLQIGRHVAPYPVVQGAMAGRVSGARLAAAVANAGGVGVIASFGLGLASRYFDPAARKMSFLTANRMALLDELHLARQLCPDGVIGVNVLVAARDYADQVRTAAANGADLIVAGAGLPLDLPALTANSPEVALVPMVSSLEMVQTICETWHEQYQRLPDGLIVENCRVIGGHFGSQCEQVTRPDFSIADLLLQIRDYLDRVFGVSLPLIVAGGIWNRTDVERAFLMGANGVQVGTRWITTEECDADVRYKEFHLRAQLDDVVVVPSPVGKPARALRNRFTDRAMVNAAELDRRCVANCLNQCLCRDGRTTYCILQALVGAAKGDVEDGLVFSSGRLGEVDRILPVVEVMRSLV